MKTFRPGATLLPFFLWTVIVLAGAILAEHHALFLRLADDRREWVYHVFFFACLVLGPLAFTAHMVRRALITVSADPAQGLVLSRGRAIPWSDIRSIEHRAGPFRGGRPLSDIDLADTPGCFWIAAFDLGGMGCVIGLAFYALALLGYYVLLPVLSLLSPWHARVIVHLKDGGRLVFRDLEEDEEFVRLARQAMAEGQAQSP